MTHFMVEETIKLPCLEAVVLFDFMSRKNKETKAGGGVNTCKVSGRRQIFKCLV